MDAVTTCPSLFARARRWLEAFDQQMNAGPLDDLELRVAVLERRLNASAEDAAAAAEAGIMREARTPSP